MADEPRQRPRRRGPLQVEPLEGRALLSAVRGATRPGYVHLVMSPSTDHVNPQDGSFTVNLYLKKEYSPRVAATLAEPLTVDFSASINPHVTGVPYGSVTPEAARSMFAPFHTSVTFPAGVSAATVTVPIVSNATTNVPRVIELKGLAPGSKVIPDFPRPVYLYSGPDAEPPTITGVQPVTRGKLASAVVLGFSKPMARATVENVHNYRILSRPNRTTEEGFLFWGGSATTEIRSFPIATASYDPSTWTVTLTLKRPVRASSLYEVASAYPLKGHELTDTKGRPLAIATPLGYGFVMVGDGEFTTLIHPIPGFTPSSVGRLKTTRKLDSPASNLNPLKGFK